MSTSVAQVPLKRSASTSEPQCSSEQQQQQLKRARCSQELTAPKLSRHNDAAYYPNIQCILCKEWVCSRNRYMHIESHLQYRPYKCSVCAYDNRKEIFINLHIKKAHHGAAEVVYSPDAELEHRAWLLAERCLQHTRELLVDNQPNQQPAPLNLSKTAVTSSSSTATDSDDALLAPYAQVYRPKIYNTQRIEKSHQIEESRQLGLVPDFSEVAERETQCCVCDAFVLSHNSLLEEHARQHLSKHSYRCGIDNCSLTHHTKNFLTRHMKEVHKYRRSPIDLLDSDASLLQEFKLACGRSFPAVFAQDGQKSRTKPKVGRPATSALQQLLNRPPAALTQSLSIVTECRACRLCGLSVNGGEYGSLYAHAKSHLPQSPYVCKLCQLAATDKRVIQAHISAEHCGSDPQQLLVNRMGVELAQHCNLLLLACFPGVQLQPDKHDTSSEHWQPQHTASAILQLAQALAASNSSA